MIKTVHFNWRPAPTEYAPSNCETDYYIVGSNGVIRINEVFGQQAVDVIFADSQSCRVYNLNLIWYEQLTAEQPMADGERIPDQAPGKVEVNPKVHPGHEGDQRLDFVAPDAVAKLADVNRAQQYPYRRPGVDPGITD